MGTEGVKQLGWWESVRLSQMERNRFFIRVLGKNRLPRSSVFDK